jgi:endonuclease/exonuclease/phosphatase family metal-dependent hydrolase
MSRKNALITILVVIVSIVVAAYLINLTLSPGGEQKPAQGPEAPKAEQKESPPAATQEVKITTWNLRGYPEKSETARRWFSGQLRRLRPDILCVQEIANRAKVNHFLSVETLFTNVVFEESPDGQDNAIFFTSNMGMKSLPAPQGFQHPARAAYVWSGGFDAVLITVHLSWTNIALREQEKKSLKAAVDDALKIDPDVIVAGDFNTEGMEIGALASTLGMAVMEPTGQAASASVVPFP